MSDNKRVIILMMDSFGIGGAKDAAAFGDAGANTLAHIVQANGGLNLPNLARLGLFKAAAASDNFDETAAGPQTRASFKIPSAYGYMQELSKGKDTSSGHWEMAGVPVLFDWGYFKPDYPSFPQELIAKICAEAGLKGILGNKAASGTEIIAELGEEHIKTGLPICYTSADSVFQIAAHEKHFGLQNLYALCEIAFKHLAPYNIARVIARPFEGDSAATFKRTKNRHDYSVKPPAPTILDIMKSQGGNVIAIGKISDIFAGQGITRAAKASGLAELWDVTLREVSAAPGNSIIFTNFVDFDMAWGHRRDYKGYGEGLEYFDTRLPELAQILQDDDIVFITADHGCDPCFKGTDHTRENVPLIVFGKNVKEGFLGKRTTFADLGQSAAAYLKLPALKAGQSFL